MGSDKDLLRSLACTSSPSALPQEVPKRSWKRAESIQCCVDVTTAPLNAPRATIPPSFGKSESEKNDQRYRKQPCYGASCCQSASTSVALASRFGKNNSC